MRELVRQMEEVSDELRQHPATEDLGELIAQWAERLDEKREDPPSGGEIEATLTRAVNKARAFHPHSTALHLKSCGSNCGC